MKRTQARRFTLTELLVGTAILLIMMTLLFQILGTLTKGWSLARSNARVYEQAQLTFDMMGRDFQTAIAGKQGGKPIGIWWGEGTPCVDNVAASRIFKTGAVQAHMISLSNETSGEGPSELHYRYVPPTSDSTYGQIYRASVKESDTVNWDFLKDADNWYKTPSPDTLPTPYFPLIKGVRNFSIKVSKHEKNELPDAVMVTITLVDADAVDTAQTDDLRRKRIATSARSFTKVFFLGRDRRLGEPKAN